MTTPSYVPRLTNPPSEPDVVVIGAGAAGIAAARHLVAAGRSVALIEARPRIGGRAVTVSLRGHPVDLGAHWLHAGSRNPLYQLGLDRGEPLLRTSTYERRLLVDGRPANADERNDYDRAWSIAQAAYEGFTGEDRCFASVLPPLGRWQEAVESAEILLSGRPLAQVSFLDQPPDDLYTDNHFVAGGYGAYLARLAEGLPIRTGCEALAIDWSGSGVTVETSAGMIRARAAIATVPATVLKAGGLRFSPPLPAETAAAIDAFLVGTYEHAILHWPGAPFRETNRFATLLGGRHGSVSLMTRLDGSPLHYMELNHNMVDRFGGARRFAEDALRSAFDPAALADCTIIQTTNWRDDRWSLGAWGVLPAGARGSREVLMRPVGDRIWFAGEALAGPQWGTVGGAWQQGERAAREVAARVGRTISLG